MKHSTREKLYRIFDGVGPVTAADRTWALSVVGSSQAEFADQLGVTRQSVSDVLRNKCTSYNIATALAAITGLTLQRLWPCGKYAESPAQRRARAQTPRHAA